MRLLNISKDTIRSVSRDGSHFEVVLRIPLNHPDLKTRKHEIETCLGNIQGLIDEISTVPAFQIPGLFHDELQAAKESFSYLMSDIALIAGVYRAISKSEQGDS